MAVTSRSEKANTPKRSSRGSFTMRRTNDWVVATDVPTDVVVYASGTSFSLHKFPLVARSGLIRKLVAEARDSELSQLDFPEIPGGAEAFELATKFCYGINIEITISNVAMLRCVAEYLEMTDVYTEKNLVTRAETFLSEVGTQSLTSAVVVLHTCEDLLPMAEELKIVSRCIDAAASKALLDQVTPKLSRSEFSNSGRINGKVNFSIQPKGGGPLITSWAEELSILRLDFYQRVLAAMRSRGVRPESIWETLVHYAQCSIKGLNIKQISGLDSTMQAKIHDSSTPLEHEQRILVETLVSLLPSDRNPSSCSFLFSLLRTAIILDTTVACRLDLERRISMQLEQATLDDILVPSFSYNGDTVFDVDLMHRLVVSFLQQQENEEFHNAQGVYDSDDLSSPSQSAILKVGRLLDSYLAEIAPDANLKLNKFVDLAEVLPEYSRTVDDGLYRAIDIYLKAHPSLNDVDRKKLCKLMDPQKLSQEACAHAAQNERLHVQFMVQVLYFEQLRLRTALANSFGEGEQLGKFSSRINSGQVSAADSPRDSYAFLRRENRELKLELARMRTRLSDLEKDHVRMKQDIEKPPSVANNKIFQAVSKKLGKLNPFVRNSSKEPKNISTPDLTNSRRRRHSMS
ncbi:hypothetical protein O6H91_12G070800 [Diphasiastrum complanatum]|uniref:Uncharacterized protein n=2 Tax=Diphasiastrum complanatum TaxID=34168 RepID=A0ACC2C3D9_DIPCM|nr:hypothetical protein O6H91_12G070800 [Diphasiastrum complanatum]KAJ7536465.1 hypothetical protein O6H91_12G070800 [Diphasiastrum complanatum]